VGEEGTVLRFTGSGVSDVGLVRAHNEDSAFVGPYLAVVADGVGGAAAGEVASATATYVMAAQALANSTANPAHVLAQAITAARVSMLRGVEADPRRAGMATTLTALVTDGQRLVLGHVGDSRAYLLRDGQLRQLSTDHTFVQQLVAEGQLTPEEAHRHPWRHVVVRSLHVDPRAAPSEVDLVEVDVRVGDRFLLCSDGLSDYVEHDLIAGTLLLADPQAASARLVQQALEAGGRDNVTAVVVDVVDGPRVCGDGLLLGAVRDLGLIVDPGSVRAG
jgi:serine/threonine protein phosphatase PrpC